MNSYFRSKKAFIMYISIALLSLGTIGMPYLLEIYTEIVLEQNMELLKKGLVITIAYIVFMFLMSWCVQQLRASVKESINRKLISNLTNNIFNRSLVDFKKKDDSYYLSLINNDVKNWVDIKFAALCEILSQSASLLFASVYAFFISPMIAVLLLVASIMFAFFPRIFSSKVQNTTYAQNEELEKYNKATLEGTKNYKVLFMSNAVEKYRVYFKNCLDSYLSATKRFTFWNGISGSFVSLFSLAIQYLILLLVVYLTLVQVIEAKYFFTLFSLSNLIVYPIFSVSQSIVLYKSATLIEEKLKKELQHPIVHKEGSTVDVKDNCISVQNMSFAYDDSRKIFEKFNLQVQANSKIMMKGASGSGKSTLIALLTKQLEANEGKISIGDYEIGAYSLSQLHDFFTLIPATPCVFSTSIQNNITLFQKDVDVDRMWEAMRIANIDHLVQSLEKKEHTILAKGLLELSDGEKQRIELARGIYKNTPIFILDEATANIDRDTALEIERALCNMPNKTIVSISHRHDAHFDALYEQCIHL